MGRPDSKLILKATLELLVPALTTVFIPPKSGYTELKLDKPVVLMNTLGKIMDTLLARWIQHITETCELPPTYTDSGGRKNLPWVHKV
ncbi:uncharacterized protein K444DRAFT_724469 [Hyaloscypha bicolor E]|uniref:Uncharacterized protein n=1 Tax=Hyaloscypha bicolor E TaxID=1095630 RepID=A0A2J6T725_9HELO|nr:uncharacterized protein K444DRAFT_724469 [Hyaloscypha bicolor E]PMD58820.1 hypothetical protein K444DRAFT_724469 [Hyaloscypha bicolor E]